jgi:hypothetical protein
MPDVLVAGGGPTGLLAAYELERAGLDVLVLERGARPATQSKALGLQPRSIEVLDDLGLLAAVKPHVEARLPAGHFSVIPRPESRPQLGQYGRQEVRAHGLRRAEPYRTGRRGGGGGELGEHPFFEVEDPHGVLGEQRTGTCGRDTGGMPVEQRRSHETFQRLDMSGDRGLHESELRRRGGDPAIAQDGEKAAEQTRVHRVFRCPSSRIIVRRDAMA